MGDTAAHYFPGSGPKLLALHSEFTRGRLKGSLQKVIFSVLVSCTQNGFEELMRRRFETLNLDRLSVSLFPNIGLMNFASKVKTTQPPHARLALLSTWTNGWFTSSRLNEAKCLDCIFGCDQAEDELVHYLNCEVL